MSQCGNHTEFDLRLVFSDNPCAADRGDVVSEPYAKNTNSAIQAVFLVSMFLIFVLGSSLADSWSAQSKSAALILVMVGISSALLVNKTFFITRTMNAKNPFIVISFLQLLHVILIIGVLDFGLYFNILIFFLAVATVGSSITESKRQYFFLGYGLVLLSLSLHIIGVGSYVESDFGWNLLGDRFSGLFTHSNYAGFFILILIAFGIELAVRKIHLGVLLFALFATEQRAAIIAVLIFFFIQSKVIKKRIALVVIPLSAGFVIFFWDSLQFSRTQDGDLTTGRDYIWSTCWALSGNNHWTGLGANFFEYNVGVHLSQQYYWFSHCHNQFLSDLVTFGSILTLSFAVAIILWLRRNWSRFSDTQRAMLLPIFLVMLVETPWRSWESPRHAILFFLVFLLYEFEGVQYGKPELARS